MTDNDELIPEDFGSRESRFRADNFLRRRCGEAFLGNVCTDFKVRLVHYIADLEAHIKELEGGKEDTNG